MQDNSFLDLVASFEVQSSKVKNCLTDLLDVVKSGCVPSKEDMSNLNDYVSDLHIRYDAIYDVAKSTLSADELPLNGVAVEAIAEAVNNSHSKFICELLDRARGILEKFISIKSLIDGYALALAPYQSAASDILNQLEEKNVEGLLPQIKAPELFLQAMEAENIHSPSGIDLMTKVQESFPDMAITVGLITKQYYYDGGVPTSQIEGISPNASVPSNESIQNGTENDSTHEEENSGSSTIETTNGDSCEDDRSNGHSTDSEPYSSAMDERAIENGELLSSRNNVKISSPSVKAFKNDLKTKYPPIARVFLPLLTNLGALTVSQAYEFAYLMDCLPHDEESKDAINQCASKLSANKGILSSFYIRDGSEIAYCLTPYSYGCLRKSGFKDGGAFALSLGKYALEAKNTIKRDILENAISMNDTLLCYLTHAKETLSEEQFQFVKSSIRYENCAYHVSAFCAGEEFSSLLYDDVSTISSCENLIVLNQNYDPSKLPPHSRLIVFKDGAFSVTGTAVSGMTEDVSDEFSTDDIREAIQNDAGYTPHSGERNSQTDSEVNEEEPSGDEIEPQAESNIPHSDSVLQQDETATGYANRLLSSETVSSVIADELISFDKKEHADQTVADTPVSQEKFGVSMIYRLVNSSSAPSDDELFELISSILNENAGNAFSEDSYIAQALLLAKAASFSPNNTKCRSLYRQLTLATKSPLDEIAYTSENLSSILNSDSPETIVLAALLFGLLMPESAYDYSLNGQAAEYLRLFEDFFPTLSAIKPLFAKIYTVHTFSAVGFSETVLAHIGSDAEKEEYTKKLQSLAKDLLPVSVPKTKGKKIKALPALYSALFDKESDLHSCLKIVSGNKVHDVESVDIVLLDYCDEEAGLFTINSSKVEQKLDNMWRSVNGDDSSFQFGYDKRRQALRQIYNRLNVIKAWAEHVGGSSNEKYDFGRLRILRDEIVKLSNKAQSDISEIAIEYKAVIVWALKTISNYLSSPCSKTTSLFNELAYTGVISLDNEMLPILSQELDSVKYYEPWRTVLRHILSPIKSLEVAKNEILDGGEDSDLFDNLHQLEVIGKLTGEALNSTETQNDTAKETALGNSKDFDDALELAFLYNRISETEKENLTDIKSQYEEVFFERRDYGIWRQFLKALQKRIDELADSKQADLQRRLDARYAKEAGEKSAILQKAQKLLDDDRNYAVTEEYINRFDNGEEDFSEDLQSVLQEQDYFSEFISDEVFNPIYDECYRCRNNNFHNVARDYLSKNFPAEWTSRLKEDSLRFVGKEPKNEKYWPIRKDTATPAQMVALFSWIGLKVTRAEKSNNKSEEMFKLSVIPSPKSMADYRHPISQFGTQAKSQMNVIVLHGNIPAKQLVDKITGLGLGGMSVVILNYPINLAVRRQIAEEFHKTTGQNPFIVIDQVLIMHLAQHQTTERLPVMLNCTLPYTVYQPFIRDLGDTPDEMFFGRVRELNDIINPSGACIVYGGRQLGKTALLRRAESLVNKPAESSYAVWCDIREITSELEVVSKISDEVREKTGLSIGSCKNISELCKSLSSVISKNRIERFLLLLDETGAFLEAISSQAYAPIYPLVELKRKLGNKFKFVLAGTHNVCRAKNATTRDGIFGQLGTPLCVKPLSPSDAFQLLSRPLRYLGFQIDRYPHLETILTNTNYYPGILQFFGYMLVETLSTHYGKYYRAVDGNPPYTLRDDQLGAVMNSADLSNSIRAKFRLSLDLDPRYFMIARCIAILYYLSEESTNTWLGFSIEEIMDIATMYKIRCLQKENENDYKNLLDEMVEMGILSKPDAEKNLYRLRRSSFINIIGSDFDAVDADIKTNNREDE